jgi:CheY-like chemotaxis protein
MKILVVDDTPEQLVVAKKLLAGHEVVTASGWSEARKLLSSYTHSFDNPQGFEVVLTDLMMSGEGVCLAPSAMKHVGQYTPYGFVIALLALRRGVQKVAIVSNGQGEDGNHHNHPILWACDSLHGFEFQGRLMFFAGSKCPYMDKGETEVDGIESPYHLKNWRTVLETLTKPE